MGWTLAALWTLVVSVSFTWSYFHEQEATRHAAAIAARTQITKDVIYRRWNAEYGGVYVPISESSPPNPYLTQVEERDIETPSGRRLTLINPAYMTRQVHELGLEAEGVHGHITSLDPIRPANAPDDWEKRALETFEGGEREFSSIEILDGEAHLRLMRPLITEKSCLKCHAQQGYKEGQIRGGISFSTPMAPYWAMSREKMTVIGFGHGALWLLGLAGIGLGVHRIGRHIAERDRAEEALRESEEKYKLLVENADDAIFIAQDEAVKFPNPKTEQMTGYSAEELAKIRFGDFIHPEDREKVIDRHRRRLTGEELTGTYSFRIINRDNEELTVELNTVLISWEGRPATLNLLRDITQQEKLEAQLQQAQKMEALGILAGGIAHNFNNVLMGIQGRASFMMLDKDGSHPDFEHLKGIEEYVQNAVELTKDLLGFARGGKYEPRPIDLNELIKHENLMFGRTKKEIKIHGKYNKDLWTVEVDQGQIRQVLMNLYVNAWQAMPGGGDLYTQTENVTLDENYVKFFEIIPGRYVKISVTDTGIGMDEATRERIFDPFFTTHEMGTGTGLGLASVYGIVKNHGGF
ncbi:MAG: DUF3365 domain-containing protein, partial [Deltaproteobacteria bacterium]|nr:DUF3365 domain-containing protein [Deltaproteobacteria bacterium]